MNKNMRGDFQWESRDEAIMIFVHNRTKTATPKIYLLDSDFEFFLLFFRFDVFVTSGVRLAIHNGALFRSENFHHGARSTKDKAAFAYCVAIRKEKSVTRSACTIDERIVSACPLIRSIIT